MSETSTIELPTLAPAAIKTTAVAFNPFAGPEILRLAPITEPQAEIWAACLVGGDAANRAYNESVSLRLSGPLDQPALARAVQAVVHRHEALRSVFSADGQHSCVLRSLPVALAYQDIAHASAAGQAALVAAYVGQEAQHLFNLLDGPLLKAGLLRLAADDHYLVLTAHHIVCDGWSMGILLQDISAFYSAYCQGLYPDLLAATSFSAYADQQLLFSRSADYQVVEQFWLRQYQGPVPVLTLPTDFARPALRTYQSTRADYTLPPALVAGLKQLGLRAGCSLVTTLLAAFEVLLHRLTGQADVVVGLPAAGQSATGMPRLVGHCVNLLPLRSQVAADKSFTEYLQHRKPAIFDAYEHQQLTFGSLLKQLRVARDASRVPLVPVVFNVDMGMANGVAFHGLHYELRSNPRAYETFELFLNASGSEQALVLEWSYNTALFTAATIERMMANFEYLIGEIVAAPTAPLRDLALADTATAADGYQALNATAQPYPIHKTLHELIAEQVHIAPRSLAVQFKATELTYEELDKRANQLANYLLANGLQPGDTIGLAVARAPELLIALLASMKCGATYVPLDPTYPAERLAFMLADSGAKLLLASDQLATDYQVPTLLLATALASAAAYPVQAPAVTVASTSPLYVLYTSGSTGRPKGVSVSHRNVVNFLHSMQQAPGISPADRLLAVTTISFDIAGLELYLPLISGATIVLADAATAKDGPALLRLLATERITIMQATPASWRLLLAAGWEQPLPLKILCGGEALPLELAHRLLEKSQSVWNMYGPTETTIWSAIKQITRAAQEISIGQPIANTQFYVLDEHQRPVPAGTVGELCIAGDGVALGYLRRPELTAEKFIANPFAPRPGERLYRTGDLGKLLPSGELQCLGRVDQQLKIRGYRIEPGEIEHVLTGFAEVGQAVVVVQEPRPGDERLVAYVVPASAAATATAAQLAHWKKALLAQLPAYMVPSEFVLVAALPLTLNGKVDRQALPPLPVASPAEVLKISFIGPRTATEKLVAAIWQDCLGSPALSVVDNFFELGGHSLLAVQVMARLEKETGKRLPLATLFEQPTIEKLAAILQVDSAAITWDVLVPIKPTGTKPPLYIVHGVCLNVLIFNGLASSMDADQPVYALQAKGLNGIDEPLTTVEAMATHYVAAITVGNPVGPYALAGYSFGGIIAYEMAKQLVAAGKEVKFLGLFDTYAHQSDFYDPRLSKLLKRSLFFLKKWNYELRLFRNSPKEVGKYKLLSLKQKAINRIKRNKQQQYEQVNGHPYRLGLAQLSAQQCYCLTPQPLPLYIFRSKERIFYVEDFECLGWKPFALAGFTIHDLPGNHNSVFLSPHDKESARIVQHALDSCL
ncbi:MAG: non-ribosomal peptide synthetase [Janthinobacterium lividum]